MTLIGQVKITPHTLVLWISLPDYEYFNENVKNEWDYFVWCFRIAPKINSSPSSILTYHIQYTENNFRTKHETLHHIISFKSQFCYWVIWINANIAITVNWFISNMNDFEFELVNLHTLAILTSHDDDVFCLKFFSMFILTSFTCLNLSSGYGNGLPIEINARANNV